MFHSAEFLSSWHQCSDSFVNIILFQHETVQLHELGPICKFPLRFPSLFLNFKIQLSRIFPRAGKTAIVIFTFLFIFFILDRFTIIAIEFPILLKLTRIYS